MKKSLNLLLLVLILNVACVESESEEILIQKVTIKVSAAVAVTISNDDNNDEYKYGICSDGEIKVLPSVTKDDLIVGSHDLFNEFDFEVNSYFSDKNIPLTQVSQVSELNDTTCESMVQSALGQPEGEREFQHLRKCIVKNLDVSETVYVGYNNNSEEFANIYKKAFHEFIHCQEIY